MPETPSTDPARSQPPERAPSSSSVTQPPPPVKAATQGGEHGGKAAVQPEDSSMKLDEGATETALPAVPPEAAATALPLAAPPPPSASATPAPPTIVEPASASSASTPRPPVYSATHSSSPEPDKFVVEYSDAYRAAQSASQWNGLLNWARGVRLESSPGGAERGWDFGTGMCVLIPVCARYGSC